MKTAVILFAYKRPRYLKKTLAALERAYLSLPYISVGKDYLYYDRINLDRLCFIDYSEIQPKIFDLVSNSGMFDKVTLRNNNYGLSDNIKHGIFEAFQVYDAVIILEDDIVIEPDALIYLQNQLIKHKDNKEIGQVNLQGNHPSSHGWAIWKDRWEQIDWDNVPYQEGELLKQFNKHGAVWDIIFHHNFDSLGWKAIGEKKAKHIGRAGEHFKWYSNFRIRKYFREWKDNYYRDKDLIMGKEKLPETLFRRFL